jgi:hypothetical protein
MSSERVLSLRNRAVRVALSLFPSPDLPTTTMDPVSDIPAIAPVQDPDDLQSRLAAMERSLRDLSLRIPVREQLPPQAPVALVQPAPVDPHGIVVRNRRYDTVLSVATYRLRDQTAALRPDQMTSLSSTAALIRPRLEGSFFSGSPSLRIIPFLAQVVRVADQTHISEATLLWILEDFLRSPVKEAFRVQAHDTWPSAIQWLLTSYAPETALDSAVRKLQTTSQGSAENVRDFGIRLQSDASLLGALVPISELKALFSQGRRDPVCSHFAANQPATELLDTVPLSVLIGRAELLERGTTPAASVSSPVRYRTNPTRLALAIQTHASDEEEMNEDLAIMAVDPAFTRDTNQRGLTCFVCYQTGHTWLECPYIRHLSAEEKEGCAYRRRLYYERRKSQWKGRPWDKPGWETGQGRVRPNQSWKEDLPTGSKEEIPTAKNATTSPRE